MTEPDLVERVSASAPAVVADATAGANGWTTAGSEALGIRALTMIDGPLGLVSPRMDERDASTLHPSGTLLAATWDPVTVGEAGAVLGAQARKLGFDAVLAPNLGIPRNPFSGRVFEMFSEDPLLTGRIAQAWSAGVHSAGVGTVPKHLVGNDTETERRAMNAQMSETTLREVYLLPFEYALKSGAPIVLMAYNRFDGVHCVENATLMGIVKDEWGWPGAVVSDWFGVLDGPRAAAAGTDLEMPGPPIHFGRRLADAVDAGQLERGRLDDMAVRLATAANMIDALPYREPVDTAAAVLRRVAASGMTLVRNEDATLPMDQGRAARVAVIGVHGERLTLQGGTFAKVTPDGGGRSVADALRAKGLDVESVQGVPRAAPLPLSALRPVDDEGRSGVSVSYARADGTPVSAEHREEPSFVWFSQIPALGATSEGGVVTVTATIVAESTGDYVFGIAGTGVLELALDGRVVATRDAPNGADVMGVVARAEPVLARIALEKGAVLSLRATAVFSPGRVQALTVTGLPPERAAAELLEEACRAAARSDIAIMVVGDDESTSRESADVSTTALAHAQRAMIAEVVAAAPRSVVVVNSARIVQLDPADRADAVLLAWYPGQWGADAIADVLVGDAEPGGRLPVTAAFADENYAGAGQALDAGLTLDYEASEPVGMRHFEESLIAPRYPLGHGLGYTRFEIEIGEAVRDLKRGSVTVPVTVRNVGNRPGSEVVQGYVRRADERSHRLGAFVKTTLNPGASTSLVLRFPPRVFARWDERGGGWCISAEHPHLVAVGTSATQLLARQSVAWSQAVHLSTAAHPDDDATSEVKL